MWLMSELQLSACVIAQLSFNNHRRAARHPLVAWAGPRVT
jgi:hypothetical protein